MLETNSVNPDQEPRSVASDLGLHCLPMCLTKKTLGIYGLMGSFYKFQSRQSVSDNL